MPRFVAVDFERVHLDRPPLVMVLCQLRFHSRPQLADREVVERLVALLGGEYPDIEERETVEVQLPVGPPGVELRQQSSRSHVLRSPEHPWWVLIAPAVATLVTPVYSERSEFLARIGALRKALQEVGVPAATRVGVRYVSRVADETFLGDLNRYLRPEVLGASGLPVVEGAELAQSLLDVAVQNGSATARVRVGLVPPGVSPDPAVDPVDVMALLMDLDMWDSSYRSMDKSVEDCAAELAAGQYELFRWLVTDEYLKHFGGHL